MLLTRITKGLRIDLVRQGSTVTTTTTMKIPSTTTTTSICTRTMTMPYNRNNNIINICWFSSISGSDSITYSGGQASVGQGGFYGSGGARALSPDHVSTSSTENVFDQQNKERSKMLAMAHDVQTVRVTMQELELLESLLRNEEESNASKSSSSSSSDTTGVVSSKSMEIKNSIKKLMTSTDFLESLNNLEVQGEPAWGLSCEEREMIILAREKVNAC